MQVNSEIFWDGILHMKISPGTDDRLIGHASFSKKEIEMNRAMLVVLGVLTTALAAGPATAADGKAVWDKSCAGCHAAMAPKTGDKTAWAPLIKRGAADLTASVMKGKAPMPPKGGAASEADVRAAIDYIISQMQ
jgi:cytochrome c5